MDPMMFYARRLADPAGVAERAWRGERDRLNHVALIEALAAGDGQAARRIVADYITEVWEVLAHDLDSSPETNHRQNEEGIQ